MNNSALLRQLEQWHNNDDYARIVEAVLEVPEEERDYQIKSQLARAYNNLSRYAEGLSILLTLEQEGKNDPLWHYRLGYSYFHLGRIRKAAEAFRGTLRLAPDDADAREMLEYCRYQCNRDNPKRSAPSPTEQYSPEEIEAVEAYIEETYGKIESVFHEIVSPDIHLDIAIIAPSPERNFYTLVTMGMGAHVMNVPKELQKKNLSRAELLICLPPDWKIGSNNENWYWPIRLLKVLGRLPLNDDTWLGWGHTIDSGNHFAPATRLCGSILCAPCLQKAGARLLPIPGDEEDARCVLPKGDVRFYQVIPLYREEMDLKIGANAEKLFSLFSGRLSPIVNPIRRNFAEIKEDK